MDPLPPEARRHWTLDPAVAFLNHGSFGACPAPVLRVQEQLRARLERQPLQFFRDAEGLLDETRAALAALVGADADDLGLVPNATTGVGCVLRALQLRPGDQLLTTDHAYNACRNALAFCAAQGAELVVARVPFPLASAEEVTAAVLGAVTPQTRLALVDHVTSPTGLVFPIARLVSLLQERGVDVLVDGAHAPGMVPLDLRGLGAAYFTGNCHKWLCTPKGSAFLHVRRDRQAAVPPWAISHGWSSPRTDRSRFRLLWDWVGTCDPTPWLCIPEAIRFLEGLLPGGLPALQRRNRALALEGRALLCSALGVPAPAPEEMIGSLASVPLPEAPAPPDPSWDPLQRRLLEGHGIEVPVIGWPASPRRLLRISIQAYNRLDEVERLAGALLAELAPWPRSSGR